MIDLGIVLVFHVGYRFDHPKGNGQRTCIPIHALRFACGCVAEHEGVQLRVTIFPGCPCGPHQGRSHNV